MWQSDPCALTHSWPLFDAHQQLELGVLLDEAGPLDATGDEAAWAAQGIGRWSCDLSDDALTWSDGVYELFNVPRGAFLDRRDIVTLYTLRSRAVMERLRHHAIRHRRGFTLDAEIRPIGAAPRWMRLVAWPECVAGKAVGLRGLKRIIDRPAA